MRHSRLTAGEYGLALCVVGLDLAFENGDPGLILQYSDNKFGAVNAGVDVGGIQREGLPDAADEMGDAADQAHRRWLVRCDLTEVEGGFLIQAQDGVVAQQQGGAAVRPDAHSIAGAEGIVRMDDQPLGGGRCSPAHLDRALNGDSFGDPVLT
ncbi:MAG: hypothetical protein WBN43_07530 [Thiogranum sp.]